MKGERVGGVEGDGGGRTGKMGLAQLDEWQDQLVELMFWTISGDGVEANGVTYGCIWCWKRPRSGAR